VFLARKHRRGCAALENFRYGHPYVVVIAGIAGDVFEAHEGNVLIAVICDYSDQMKASGRLSEC
jgi:hypothetical protein